MNPFAAIKTVALVREVISLGQEIYSWFADDPEPVVEKKKLPRKKPDTTKLTQHHYDFILNVRQQWKHYNEQNPKNKKTLQDLTDVLNEKLGMNKSTRAYSRVWSGEIDPNDLPTGKPLNF